MVRNSLAIFSDTTIKSRQILKRSSKFIRMRAWNDKTDWSKGDEEDDRQSDIEKKSVPRRRARRIKLNWGPDGDKGEEGENDAEGAAILIGNAMLIRASAVNNSNMELLTNTLRRQGKKWELTTVDGESFFKVE